MIFAWKYGTQNQSIAGEISALFFKKISKAKKQSQCRIMF